MQGSGDFESAEPHASPFAPIATTTTATMACNGDDGAARKPSVSKMALLNQQKTSAELLISGKTTYVPEDGLR